MKTSSLKDKLRRRKKRKRSGGPRREDYLSTGSTLINLACSGTPYGGFPRGHYIFLVGDSSSGKTFLSLTCLAEAAANSVFDDYRFIYDNAEDGALMDVVKFFGSKVASRMEPPDRDDSQPICSTTIEEFYYHVDDAVQKGIPFIYILDSMDALTSAPEQDKFQKTKKAYRKGEATAGSYGDGKAKYNSGNLRKLINPLKETKSILIIINQTRDNLGFGFEKKTRSGGHALKFYATLEMWSSVKQKITKTVKGKKRQLGVLSKVKVKKNRVTGREREVDVPIYHSYGIDDIGSCVDYLVDEGHWKKRSASIVAPEFDWSGRREGLIAHIEEEQLEAQLRSIVGQLWQEIEEACSIERKRRYK